MSSPSTDAVNPVAQLIATVLSAISNQFYGDKPMREFLRDERYLVAALATYGKECADRGWHFDAPAIQRELMEILRTFKKSGVEIQWMPIYLQGAIRRHIGQRAEELQAAARNLPKVATKIIAGVQPVAVIEKTDTEVLALMYHDVRKLRRQSRAAVRNNLAVKKQQPTLL